MTDFLTLALSRYTGAWLTSRAAALGLTPGPIRLVGMIACAATFWQYWNGHFWSGTALACTFIFLTIVADEMAEVAPLVSPWSLWLGRGLDLLLPPFWWWAWLHGLGAGGHQLEEVYKGGLLAVIVGTYVAGKMIEGIFHWRFKFSMHLWRPADSRFRLVTAGRNTNMAILLACLIIGRPDLGIELVALWSVLSLIFHAMRLAQAEGQAARGRPIMSWRSEA